MTILAIDPGVDTGWALYSNRTLVDCGLGNPKQVVGFKASDLTGVIIEHPMVYPNGKTADPNAIVRLAVNAGQWAGRFEQWCEIRFVYPWQWKGQVPKDIHQARIWAKLSDAEKAIVDRIISSKVKTHKSANPSTRTPVPPSKRHNMMDAIGLGLFQVGR